MTSRVTHLEKVLTSKVGGPGMGLPLASRNWIYLAMEHVPHGGAMILHKKVLSGGAR